MDNQDRFMQNKMNMNDKKIHFVAKLIIRGCVQVILWGVLLFLFSLLYFFCVYTIDSYIPVLKKLIVLSVCAVAIVIIVGFIRKKSILNSKTLKRVLIGMYSLIGIVFLTFAVIIYCSYGVKNPTGFSIDTSLFSDKEVMVIIPHQDDDINLMGGILEQYADNGSRVYVVFSTNGDYLNIAPTRYKETIDVLTDVGINKENIIFLGFGDLWQAQHQDSVEVKHIYNCHQGDTVWTSANNHTISYGMPDVPCYSTVEYTRNNYLNSIKSVICNIRPDVIYAVDYDSHPDHKASSLFFEEAMGQILSEDPNYKPTVYKGFCYGTAWYAADDFLESVNILSTKKPDAQTWQKTGTSFNWDHRVRVPVNANNLNRILSNNGVYRSLCGYSSQFAFVRSGQVLNGDKVFWERRTDSLLYDAEFYAGDEAVEILNDFKLSDSDDISKGTIPVDGIVITDRVDVMLRDTITINSVGLYDSPNESDNITAGYIIFGDGSKVEFGPLNEGGEVTLINFPERTVAGFSIYITDTAGENAGFTEIEAYCTQIDDVSDVEYIMAVDADDNFVYDYWIESGDCALLELYAYPCNAQIDWTLVDISYEGGQNSCCELESGKLKVVCPEGEEIIVRISYGSHVSTEFAVSNPGRMKILATEVMQKVNQHFAYTCEAVKLYFDNILNG